MTRTTIEQEAALLDQLNQHINLGSRTEILQWLYGRSPFEESETSRQFREEGFEYSHYKDGRFLLYNYAAYGFRYFPILPVELLDPSETCHRVRSVFKLPRVNTQEVEAA